MCGIFRLYGSRMVQILMIFLRKYGRFQLVVRGAVHYDDVEDHWDDTDNNSYA